MIPYTSEDYLYEECQRQARKARNSGMYRSVRIIRKKSEERWNYETKSYETRHFARVYVDPKHYDIELNDGKNSIDCP